MVHVKAKQNKPANKQVKQIKQAKLKPYQSKQVEHQKLNQTTPLGVVWLSFWCSTERAS